MKIFAIGMNYARHVEEMANKLSEEPVFFMKPDSALLLNNKPFFYPEFSKEIHYEAEVVFKVCRLGKSIARKYAHRYLAEATIGIDFTARDIQYRCKEKGLPWEVCKSFDSSAAVGSFVPLSELPHRNELNFRLDINGVTVQQGNTRDMIFPIDHIVSELSRYFSLRVGDMIYTGTPQGVGPVHIGDHLQGYLEDQLLLDFYIR